MIDLSDGLATDARHIGEQSDMCLQIELEQLPLGEGVPDYEQAATAGEDYELCFTAPLTARAELERAVGEAGDTQVTWVGRVTDGPSGASLRRDGRDLRLQGFEHRW